MPYLLPPHNLKREEVPPCLQWMFDVAEEEELDDEWAPGDGLTDTTRMHPVEGECPYICYGSDDDHLPYPIWDGTALALAIQQDSACLAAVRECKDSFWSTREIRSLQKSIAALPTFPLAATIFLVEIAAWACCDYCTSPEYWYDAVVGTPVDTFSAEFQAARTEEDRPRTKSRFAKLPTTKAQQIDASLSRAIGALTRSGAIAPEVAQAMKDSDNEYPQ